MRVSLIFAFIFTACSLVGSASGKSGEQIQQILKANPDTNKVKLLSDMCWDYRFISADSAQYFGLQALELARALNFPKGIAQACNDIAILHIDKAQYFKATKLLNESLEIRKHLNDSTGIASIYNKLGIIDQKQGRLKQALEHQISALKIYQNLGQEKLIGVCFNNIAIIHQNLGNFDNALEYHQKGLEYRIKMKDQEGEATSYGNMANVYARLKDTLSAVSYYEKALSLSRSLKNEELISGNLSNMANIFMAQKDYPKALKFFHESLEIREKKGDSKGISSTLSRIGSVFTETGQYKAAAQSLNRSLSIAKNISVVEEELSALLALAKLKALTNQLDSSFLLMKSYIALKDSVYDERIKQQIFDVQSQYETDQLEQDLEMVKSEKELTEIKLVQRKTEIWLLVFVFISIIGAGIFFFYRHHQRQEARLNAQRLAEQETRMNAVFQAQEEERRRIAKELHDGVGQTISALKMNYQSLINQVSQNDLLPDHGKIEKMLDNAGKEIRGISHQMIPKELEQFGLVPAMEGMLSLNLENAPLKYQFEHNGFEERIGAHVELVLFRVSQELVSNVIKHSKASTLHVQLLKLASHVVLNISDNGIGFDVEKKEKNGIGLLNIASRIDGIKGHLHYESSEGSGTSVTIRAPLL